jgi:hypothetical protein
MLLAQRAWVQKSYAAFILKDPSCLYGFLDTLSRLEKFMEE